MPPPPPPTGAPAIRDRALDERERLEILRRFDLLDTAPEEDLDDLTSIAAAICGTPISLITLIDADRQWFKSRVGVEHTESPRETAFCARAIAQDDDLFVVPDAAADPRFASNPDVTGGLHVRFYAGAPLVTQEGAALGTLCVIDREPRELTAGQERALRALSRAVVAQFELRRQNERLRALDRLKDEFVAVIAHDLRTPLTAIRGYVDVLLDGGGGEITETQARFLGIVGRNADKLTRLSADLLFLARAEAGTLDLETGDVDLAELVGDAAATAGPSGRDRGVGRRTGRARAARPGRRGGRRGGGHRRRDPGGRGAAAVHPLLPRERGPPGRRARHRARPDDRAHDRRGARRDDRGREPRGRGHPLHDLAAVRAMTALDAR
jgi:signal transduction histidine kinase